MSEDPSSPPDAPEPAPLASGPAAAGASPRKAPPAAPTGRSADDDGRALLRLAAGFYGIVALFALGFGLFGPGLGALWGPRAPTLPGLLAALGIALGLVLLTRVASRAWQPMARTADALADLFGPVGWPVAVLLALLSGFAEELLFRGALWPILGLVGTTLLFGVVHVVPRRPLWVYPAFAVIAGLLLGLLREGTQSIWPPVLAHATVNALNLAWLGARARRRSAAPTA